MEEIEKLKYMKLRNDLVKIKKEFEVISDNYDELKVVMKENLMIDDKICYEDSFVNINNNIVNILNEINTTIFTNINNNL